MNPLPRAAGPARELLRFLPIYAGLSLIDWRAKLALTPAWTDGTLVRNHTRLIAFAYTNNEQSRWLQFMAPEALHRGLGLTVPHAYSAVRFFAVWAAYALFHAYLRRWFAREVAFAGVALLSALVPITFINDLQESAPMLLVAFLWSLACIRDRRARALALALACGALVNESVLALPALFFLVWVPALPDAGLRDRGWRKECAALGRQTLAIAAPAFAITALIRWITRHRPHLGPPMQLRHNLAGLGYSLRLSPFEWYRADYLAPFFLFGALWVYMALRRQAQPPFLRRALWFIPIFILPNLITGIISESRQLVPLGFLVIPMAFCFLFDAAGPPAAKAEPGAAGGP